MRASFVGLAMIGFASLVWLGCSGGDAGGGSSSGADSSDGSGAGKIDQISTKSLPSLGSYLPPLDDGRVEVAAPDDWVMLPRSNKFVFACKADPGERYPLVRLTAEDATGVSSVGLENAEALLAKVKTVKSAKNAKLVQIGERVHVLYLKRSKEPGSVSILLDRLLLTTAVGGRWYTFELRTRDGELDEGEAALYAVANGVRYLKDESPSPPAKTPEPAVKEAKEPAKETESGESLEGLEDLFN